LIKNKINNYGTNRDIPSVEGTSKLSPYIKHGQIHVEKIYKECSLIKPKNINIQKYINELGWREFSHSLINYFPEMLKGNLRKEFDKFPWVKNEKHLKAWKNGMTGYPIVDAGMRELYETGWMHNRIRMVVGSFLVKHLRINWVEGEKHFRNCLLDFNEANNVAQWQWVAGCGADAAPYFRIFNPILQGEKFDKEGLYVKKWVPELNKVPAKFIHKPWEMELKYQEAIKTIIGKDYPSPIVIHEKARVSALEAFQSLKNK
jgi:deoxyribodipyrimidine photo-lyase